MTFDRQNEETFSEPLQLIELQNGGNRGGEQGEQKQPYRLRIFEEMVGPLTGVEIEGPDAKVVVGQYVLDLPLDFGKQLRPHLGKLISILRFDDPNEPYLYWVEEEVESYTVAAGTDSPVLSEGVQ